MSKINSLDFLTKNKIKFKDENLLKKSLTHKSFDNINNNEKLEFLGDRVLGLIISKQLIEMYPDEKEGIIDKKLNNLLGGSMRNVRTKKGPKTNQNSNNRIKSNRNNALARRFPKPRSQDIFSIIIII